mmetsp:Transcript_147448/g.471461  ORF Transcript_147448/g.471461 Transcript_147448/m.471461 type:complete len:762 (-) Transcript_147448:206-2491(-)
MQPASGMLVQTAGFGCAVQSSQPVPVAAVGLLGSRARSTSQQSQGPRHESLSVRVPHTQSFQRLQDRGSPSPLHQTACRRSPSYVHVRSAAVLPVGTIPGKAGVNQDLSQEEASMYTLRNSLLQHIQTVQQEISRLQQERQRTEDPHQVQCDPLATGMLGSQHKSISASQQQLRPVQQQRVSFVLEVLQRHISRDRERPQNVGLGQAVWTKKEVASVSKYCSTTLPVAASSGPAATTLSREQTIEFKGGLSVGNLQRQPHCSGGTGGMQSQLETPRLKPRPLHPGLSPFEPVKSGPNTVAAPVVPSVLVAFSPASAAPAVADAGDPVGAPPVVDVVAAVRAAAACRVQHAWRACVTRRLAAAKARSQVTAVRRRRSSVTKTVLVTGAATHAAAPLGVAPAGVAQAREGRRPAVHWAAGRIQRAWKIYLWRRRFVDYSERELNYVGSLEWLQRQNMLYGTELADSEDVRWWLQQRTAAPLDREVDPWGAERLLEHLHRMWYGYSPEPQPPQQLSQPQQQQAQAQGHSRRLTETRSLHRENVRSRPREHRYSFAHTGEDNNASFHQHAGVGHAQWAAKSGSSTHRSPPSTMRQSPSTVANARAMSLSPRQEATSWRVIDTPVATHRAHRASTALGAPPPNSGASMGSFAKAAFRASSSSPSQSTRQPRATVAGTTGVGTIEAGCAVNMVHLRPRSPLQSARSQQVGNSPVSSRLSVAAGAANLGASARSSNALCVNSAGITRAFSGSAPLVAARSPVPASARR